MQWKGNINLKKFRITSFGFPTHGFHQRLVFWNSIHQEVASDPFCLLINSSWLLVFTLYVFSLFFSGFSLYWWKGIHFSQNLDLNFALLFFNLIIPKAEVGETAAAFITMKYKRWQAWSVAFLSSFVYRWLVQESSRQNPRIDALTVRQLENDPSSIPIR